MAEPDADFPDGLRQPDRRSCGAACLVVAVVFVGLRGAGDDLSWGRNIIEGEAFELREGGTLTIGRGTSCAVMRRIS